MDDEKRTGEQFKSGGYVAGPGAPVVLADGEDLWRHAGDGLLEYGIYDATTNTINWTGRMWDTRPLLDSIRKSIDAINQLPEETRDRLLRLVASDREGS